MLDEILTEDVKQYVKTIKEIGKAKNEYVIVLHLHGKDSMIHIEVIYGGKAACYIVSFVDLHETTACVSADIARNVIKHYIHLVKHIVR